MIVSFEDSADVRDATRDNSERAREREFERMRREQTEKGVQRMMMFIITALPAMLLMAWSLEEPGAVA